MSGLLHAQAPGVSPSSALPPARLVLRDEPKAGAHRYENSVADTAAANAMTATMSQNVVALRLCFAPVPGPFLEFSGLCGSMVRIAARLLPSSTA